MNQKNHTLGQWQVSENGWVEPRPGHQVMYVHCGTETVAQCWKTGCDRGLPDEQRKRETEANARLIAAAPELLAAAKQALFAIVEDENGRDELLNAAENKAAQMLRTAIAKAEGK